MITDETQDERSNLLTASRMRAYRECPRLHFYKYTLGYRTKREGHALRFGTLWHLAMEVFYNSAREFQIRAAKSDAPDWAAMGGSDIYRRAKSDAIFAIGCASVKNPDGPLAVGGSRIEPYDAARLIAGVEVYEKSLRAGRFLETHEILAVEFQFSFPHRNPITNRTSPLWQRAGKVDVMARHESGRIRVIEHKTTSEQIDSDAPYWEGLVLDTQIAQYLLGAESKYGLVVDECVYDVLRKFTITPLKATPKEKWRYKKRTKKQVEEGLPEDDDVLLYANIRKEDETPDEYLHRCLDQAAGRARHWHRMEVIARTESMIEDHQLNAWVTSKMMRNDERMGWAMKNPDACHRFGACAFWKVCTGQTTLDDPRRYERLETKHPELDVENI